MPLPRQVPKPVIAKLSPRHEALALFVMANPRLNQGQVARALGYTQAWVSQVMASSLFKARLRALQQELAEETIEEVKLKIVHGANLAMDKTLERLNQPGVSDAFVTAARTDLLKAVGFGAPPSEPSKLEQHVHNHLHISAEDVANARKLIGQRPTAAKLLPNSPPDLGSDEPSPAGVSEPVQPDNKAEVIREDSPGSFEGFIRLE